MGLYMGELIFGGPIFGGLRYININLKVTTSFLLIVVLITLLSFDIIQNTIFSARNNYGKMYSRHLFCYGKYWQSILVVVVNNTIEHHREHGLLSQNQSSVVISVCSRRIKSLIWSKWNQSNLIQSNSRESGSAE